MAQYIPQGDIYKDQFLNQICAPSDEWKLVKESSGIKVFSRSIPGCSKAEDAMVFKSESVVDVSPDKLNAILDPRKEYRTQWDLFVEKIEVIERISEANALVYHSAKAALAGIVSPRDSIDICSFGKISDEEGYYIIAASVEHPDYPPNSKCIRVFQYPCGYRIYPIPGEPNKSKFLMVLNTDIKMNQVASMIAEKVKPKLMIEKTENLKKWISKPENLDSVKI